MAKAGTVYVDVMADTSGFRRDVEQASRSAGSALSRIGIGALGDVAKAGGIAAVAVGGIGVAAVRASTEFNRAVSGVGAVANATAAEMEQLRQAALDAGAATSFSASEAATAEAELARAGVSVADIMGGALTGSLDLAAAGQLDLGSAATIAAQALNIFGLAGDQTTRVADVLAAGANKSAADVGQLGQALQQTGTVAAQTGLSLEETVGALSLFADAGIAGSDAGTSLKTALQRLVPQSNEAAAAMRFIGLEAFDAQGEFVGIAEVAAQLQTGLAGLSDEQRSQALSTIFGADAIRSASILMDAGRTGVEEYTAAVTDQGAAARMAATQLDNLAGDIEALSGSVETGLIRIGDSFDSTNRRVVQGATGIVNAFNEWATTPVFDLIQARVDSLGSGVTAVFEGIEDRVSDALGAIDGADVDRVFDSMERGATVAADAIDGLEGPILGASAALSTMALRGIPIISSIVPAINPVVGALGGLVLGSDQGREALRELGTAGGRALSQLGPVAGNALRQITPPLLDIITNAAELAEEVLPDLANVAGAVLPPAATILGGALSVVGGALEVIADNGELVVPVLAGIATGVAGLKLASVVADAGGLAGAFDNLAKKAATAAGSSALGGMVSSVGGLGALLTPTAGLIGVAGLAVAGLTTHMVQSQKAAQGARDRVRLYADAIEETGDAAAGASDALEQWLRASAGDSILEGTGLNDETQLVVLENMTEAMSLLGVTTEDMAAAMEQGGEAWRDMRSDLALTVADLGRGEAGFQNLKDSAVTALDGQRAAFQDAQREADLFAQITGEAATATERMATEVEGLSAELDRLTGAGRDVEESTNRQLDSMQRLAAALVESNSSLDQNTEAGRRNRQLVLDSVRATEDLAEAHIAATGDTEGATVALLGHAEQLANVMRAAGLTEEQIADYQRTLGLTPAQIETFVQLIGAEEAVRQSEDLTARLDALGNMKATPTVQALIDEQSFSQARAALDALTAARNIRINLTRNFDTGFFGNTLSGQADGSVLDFQRFAWGGFSESHVAQIAPPGTTRIWREPETGGEAYIPLAASKRGRSVAIWDETGDRLGVAREEKHYHLSVIERERADVREEFRRMELLSGAVGTQ